MNLEMPERRFTLFWKKYRPAVLQMMQGALNEWHEYQFMKHELSHAGKKPKGGIKFSAVISMSKASIDARDSEIGIDLIEMLRQSQTGAALMATNRYEIVLEKNLMLRIVRKSIY